MQAILGLDFGQTSSKACLVSLDGTVLARGKSGAIAPLLSPAGFEQCARAVAGPWRA